MDSDILQSEQWLRFVAWFEDNFRRVIGVAAVVIGLGTVVAFFVWHGGQQERTASEQLSLLLSQPEDPGSEALLIVADAHAGTEAAHRALLLAAGALYGEQQFKEAQAQFQRLLAEAPVGPLTPQARFGIAACREALGETEAAITEYRAIVDNPASGNVVPQARFALGNLYSERGQTDLAREQYEALAALQNTSLAAEARLRLAELPPAPTAPATTEATLPSLTAPEPATDAP